MKSYKEWSIYDGSYSNEASVEIEIPQRRNSDNLLTFDDEFGIIPRVLSKSFQGYKKRIASIERQTNKTGRLNQNYVSQEIIRAYSKKELTQRIYDKRNSIVNIKNNNAAIGILLDMSGSTRFNVDNKFRRIDLIKYSAIAMGRTLDTLDENFFIYGFHTHHSANPTLLEEYKSSAQKWSLSIEEKIAAIEHTAETRYFNNKDGAAIRFANERLSAMPNPKKYLILLTDGTPNCDGTYYCEDFAFNDTAKSMSEGHELAIQYLYLTINPDDVTYFSGLILPFTMYFKQFKCMGDVVEGLPLAYEKMKLL